MAENRCVMCLRSRALRTRRHVLGDVLPGNQPQFVQYIHQNALIELIAMFPHNKFNLLCKYFCLAPISANSHIQRVLNVYSLITVLCLIMGTAFSFSIHVLGKGFNVFSLAIGLVFISGIAGHITIVVESWFKKEQHEYFFAKLHELENIFRLKLQHRIQYRDHRKKLIRKYSTLSFAMISCLSAYIYIVSTHDHQGYFWRAFASSVVARMRLIQASVYVDLINFRFDNMNFLLKQILKCRVQQKNNILYMDYDIKEKTERILVLKSIYTKLNELVLCINEAFGWSILIITIYFSLDLTCSFYLLFLGMEAFLPSFHIYLTYFTIFPLGLLLFALSHTCSICLNKSDIAKKFVQQMLISSTLDHTSYLLDAFLLQIRNQPIVFHAKQFFHINLKLLTSITVSMLGYLVILIQFQLAENEL